MIDARTDPHKRASWSAAAIAELESVCAAAGCTTARDEALGRHTSMGVGGPTPLMIWPRHREAVAETIRWCAGRGLGWRVLGGGTNVLVSEAGVSEPVLSLTALTEGADVREPEAVFPAGTTSAGALKATIRRGLAGLVWATGLPGTIGGATAGNAGCWGGQMADVVTRLDVVDAKGRWHTLTGSSLDWRYRSNPLPASLGHDPVIVSVAVAVHDADAEKLRRRFDELHARKRRDQPIGARNAGCIFKNPDADHPAGRLIDEAGCKGMRIGDAQISTLHGNFLVNHGTATATDVEQLIAAVKREVEARSGKKLEEEIHRW